MSNTNIRTSGPGFSALTRPRARRAAARSVRPRLEELEARALPTANAPWYPSLMAFEHSDSGRTHVFNQATFGGSFTGGNTVGTLTSPNSFPAGYNTVYESAQQIFVYAGADPSERYGIGSFVARLDPTTLKIVWKTQLEDVRQTGDWNWPGVLSILSDGTLYAIYGYHIAKLNPSTGQVIAKATLPTSGWYAQDTAYNGMNGFPDNTLIAKTIRRPQGTQLPPTQTIVVAIDPSTLQMVSQVTVPDVCGGRITATVYNGRDYVYLTGNTSVYRLLWSGGKLTLDTSWSPGDIYLKGQAGATAPVVMNGWIVFQTNNQPSTTPLSVWAISEANASVRYTVQPFASHPLLRGRSYFDISAVSADPATGLVYAADWGPGYIGAIRITSGGLQVVWTAADSTTEHMPVIGPSNQRVLVSTDWGAGRSSATDVVVWRDAATGKVLATSPALPGVIRGGMVQPYYNGDLLYLADDGSLIELSPRATGVSLQLPDPQSLLAPDRPAAVAAVYPHGADSRAAAGAADGLAGPAPASVTEGDHAPLASTLSRGGARASAADLLDRVFAEPGDAVSWESTDW